LVRPEIKKISPYRPGKPLGTVLKEKGIERAFKLASNENPLGPSPLGIKAAKEALREVNRYPEGSGQHLRQKLAEFYGVKLEEVILGSGSSEILSLSLLTFLKTGEEVIIPELTFLIYQILILMCGGIPVKVPLKDDFGYNPEAILDAVSSKTRFLFLGSPNNPTGTIIKKDELHVLFSKLPETVIVVIDEAYAEYVESEDYISGLTFFRKRPLIVTRTFSKIYGLAGLRIGYGIADKSIIAEMNRIRPPFNTTGPAQAAAAAALDDREFIERSLENNRLGKEYLYRNLSELSLSFVPTQANFILIDLGGRAPEVCAQLEESGIIVRPVDNPGLQERYIRLTIGTPEENELFIHALRRILKG